MTSTQNVPILAVSDRAPTASPSVVCGQLMVLSHRLTRVHAVTSADKPSQAGEKVEVAFGTTAGGEQEPVFVIRMDVNDAHDYFAVGMVVDLNLKPVPAGG